MKRLLITVLLLGFISCKQEELPEPEIKQTTQAPSIPQEPECKCGYVRDQKWGGVWYIQNGQELIPQHEYGWIDIENYCTGNTVRYVINSERRTIEPFPFTGHNEYRYAIGDTICLVKYILWFEYKPVEPW